VSVGNKTPTQKKCGEVIHGSVQRLNYKSINAKFGTL